MVMRLRRDGSEQRASHGVVMDSLLLDKDVPEEGDERVDIAVGAHGPEASPHDAAFRCKYVR